MLGVGEWEWEWWPLEQCGRRLEEWWEWMCGLEE
jgi:hypothetical protein